MSEPFIGQIMPVGFNFAPRGWALCDGQLLDISSNTALFSLLGTTYGGDGRTTFALPDLRGRHAKHVGAGPGLSPVTWGEKSGNENTTLQQANIPSHSHVISHDLAVGVATQTGDGDDPDGAVIGAGAEIFFAGNADASMGGNSIQGSINAANTGNGQSFSNKPPYLGIYYCIALTGIFPSRNFSGMKQGSNF